MVLVKYFTKLFVKKHSRVVGKVNMTALVTADIAHLISEAIVVRICHDLASPSGALTNGVELLGMALGDENFQNEAIGLLKNSTTALSGRLEFYRAAFGNSNAKGLTAVGARAVAEKYVAQSGDSTRIFTLRAFPNGATDGAARDSSWWRFALLMVLVAVESAPFGGEIEVLVDDDLPVLRVAGRQAALSDLFYQNLQAVDQIDPRALGNVALRYYAARGGLLASAETQNDGFDVRLMKNHL